MKTRMMAACLLVAGLLTAKENILLVNYGPQQSIREGDDDFRQIVFFQVAESVRDSLYLRVYDMDCGGDLDLAFSAWNTTTRFELYGGKGAYSAATLQKAKPDDADLLAGNLLASATFGENAELNNSWFNLKQIAPEEGEKIGAYYYFKLVVQGISGNDANAFDVRLSTSAARNVTPEQIQMFSYSPTFRLRKDENVANITFPVPEKAQSITVHNFDLAGASLQLVTAFRSNLPIVSSGQGEWVKSVSTLEPLEAGRACAVALGQGSESPNDVSMYITDDQGQLLPISLPIHLIKLNQRPVIQKSLIALSDCQSIVFDAKSSTDPDGDLLEFYWEFGDGTHAQGSRIAHQYEAQKTYNALLIVSDNSGEVGNSAFERFKVKVNQPPLAKAGQDVITAPNQMVAFDASLSSDQDGSLTSFAWDFGDGKNAAGAKTSHLFVNPGTYRVQLRVVDDSDSPCNSATDEIKVWVNARPKAVAGEDLRGSTGQVLTFNGEKSSDSDGELVSYQWDFGDGGKASGKVVQHAYQKPGTYRARLSVTDNAAVGNSMDFDEVLVFINAPPEASAGRDMKGAIEETLTFDGSTSLDKDGALIAYQWAFGDGATGSGVRVTHAYKKSGNYTVVLTVQDDSQTDSDRRCDSLQVFINEPPVAHAGEDQLVTDSEVTWSAAASRDQDGEIISYEWDFGDGSLGTGIAPIHVYRKPGTYTGKLTVTDNSGTRNNQTSDAFQVIVNEKPFADAGPDQKGAAGQTFTFDGSGSQDPDGNIAAYLWDFGDGHSASGGHTSHAYSKPGVYTARLTVKDNTGHPQAADFDEAVVVVNGPPTAKAGSDVLTVPGDAVTFDASHSFDLDKDALSYTWQFSDGKHQAATAQVRRTFPSPGTYAAILTVSDNSSTENSISRDTVLVRINSAPIANAGKNIYSCDKTLLFDGSASTDPDGDPLSYTWNFGDGSKPAAGMLALHKFTAAGTYPVILTVDDGWGLENSRHSQSITAVINDPPVADAGPNESYCAGEVIIFNASSSKDPENGLLKYHWDFGDGTNAEGLNPTKIYKKDGIYQVRLTVQDDSGLPCNTGIAVKSIQIIESPIAMAGPDQEVCTHAPVNFDGTASRDFDGVVNNYFWDFGDGTTGGGATPTHAYKKAGVYRVVLTITGDLRSDCDNTNTDELLVTVHDAPFATITCPAVAAVNQSVTFDGSSSLSTAAPIQTYQWEFGDGSSAAGRSVTHLYSQSGNYLVKLIINTGASTICSSSITQKMITINDAPIADAGRDQLAGLGQLITLDGSGSKDPDGGLISYIWSLGTGATQSGITARHRFSTAGRHPVQLTVTDNSYADNNTAVDTVWIMVSDPVQPVISPSSSAACPNEEITFSALDSKMIDGKTVTGMWHFGDGQTASGMQVKHRYAKSGDYQVTLVLDDGLSLDNSVTSTTLHYRVNNIPQADAGPDQMVCPGQEVILDASHSFDQDETGWKVEWDFGDGGTSSDRIARHLYKTTGTYLAKLKITDHSGSACASDEDAVKIVVNSQPLAVAGPDRQVFYGGAHDGVLFDATGSSDPDGDGLVFEWDFGDGTRNSGAKLYHNYDKPGLYLVKLHVDDGRETPCSKAIDEVKIEVVNRK